MVGSEPAHAGGRQLNLPRKGRMSGKWLFEVIRRWGITIPLAFAWVLIMASTWAAPGTGRTSYPNEFEVLFAKAPIVSVQHYAPFECIKITSRDARATGGRIDYNISISWMPFLSASTNTSILTEAIVSSLSVAIIVFLRSSAF